ncbi:hypothetical protein RUM43_012248 [Polyplax serrata]|uniref:Tetraspanin n=1 Tax=Polyplax serrata TaxID=468196 RepID=A0AAN8NRY1_POLSC
MVKNRRHESECCNVLFLKYVLHIFNVIFVAAGISVLAVGIWSVIEKHKYVSLLTSVTYPMTSYTLIAAGCLVLAIAVIGSCGVAKENRCLLLIVSKYLLPYVNRQKRTSGSGLKNRDLPITKLKT